MSGLTGQRSFSKQLTGSAELASAGARVRLYSVVALSGGTAGVSTFKVGGSGGTTWLTLTCPVVSTSNTFDFGDNGILFDNGCYWTKDANTASVVVTYDVEV